MVTASVLLLARHNRVLSGFFLGLGISVVKFLPLIYAPLFFIVSEKRWRWVVGLTLCCAPVYGWFALNHCPILVPLVSEGTLRSSGNLPFLLEMVLGVRLPDRLYDGVVAIALLAIFAIVSRVVAGATHVVRLRSLSFGLAAVTLAVVLLSKKSWPPYLILVLFPICLTVTAERIKLVVFAVFNVAACAEPSAWWLASGPPGTWGSSGASGLELHQHLITKIPAAMWFLLLDSLLVCGYAWLLILAVQGIVTKTQSGDLPDSAGELV
jgi:hypothetical protein